MNKTKEKSRSSPTPHNLKAHTTATTLSLSLSAFFLRTMSIAYIMTAAKNESVSLQPDSQLVPLHELQAVNAPGTSEETTDPASSVADTDVESALDLSYLSPAPTIPSNEPPAVPTRQPVVLFPTREAPHEPDAVGVDEVGSGGADVHDDPPVEIDSDEEDSEIIAILYPAIVDRRRCYQLPEAMISSATEGGSLFNVGAPGARGAPGDRVIVDSAVWSCLSPVPTATSEEPPPAPRKSLSRAVDACHANRGQSRLSPLPTARSEEPPPAPRKSLLRAVDARRPRCGKLAIKRCLNSEESMRAPRARRV